MKQSKKEILDTIHKLLYMSIKDASMYSEICHLKEQLQDMFDKNTMISKLGIERKSQFNLNDEMAGFHIYYLDFSTKASYTCPSSLTLSDEEQKKLREMLMTELIDFLEKID